MIASLPSVSVRPCIINVNPPESRGAALTAANLIIQLARGIGPSCITLLSAIFGANRRFSLNITLIVFWTVSAIQLLFLARSLPVDQDAMEQELATYAANAMEMADNRFDEEESIVSIEDRMTSFDVGAARQSLKFVGDAIREIEEELRIKSTSLLSCKSEEEQDETDEDDQDAADIEHKRNVWLHQQQALQQENGKDLALPDEKTSLL
jgi:translation initiation factor 4G